MPGLYSKKTRKTLREYCEESPRAERLLSEWHPTKNGALTPDDVSQSSKARIWWRCEKGHEWQTQAASRTGGSGCPVCRAEYLREKRKKKELAAAEKRRTREERL